MIAPYWADSDIGLSGNVSYRILNASDPTSNLQQIILSKFAIPDFECRQVFVATYHQVPPFISQVPTNLTNAVSVYIFLEKKLSVLQALID